MSAFIVIAAAMAAIAIGCIAWPLYRSRASEGRALPATLASVAVLVPLAAFLMYQHWSTWDWNPQAVAAAGQPHSMEEAVAKLEARLAQVPDDVEGWRMLGRSRMAMNQVAPALAAYQKAYALTGGKDADVLLGYGEALVMSDENAISGQAGPMFEQALALEPGNPKALWYAGLNALRAGRVAQARDRWAALSAQNPPAEIKAILDERVADLDRQLGRPVAAPARVAGAADGAAEGAGGAAADAGGGRQVAVRVTLAPALKAQIAPGMPLFVLARDPTQPGPPLAAKRFTDVQFPLAVTLTEQDAMAPGRSIAIAKQLVIVARFSKSGMPMAGSGDVYGEIRADGAARAPLELVIDKTVP